jgi:hypothetical protein
VVIYPWRVFSRFRGSTSRGEVSEFLVSSYVETHTNCGKFRGNYHSKVLVLLDLGTRVIVPQLSAQS